MEELLEDFSRRPGLADSFTPQLAPLVMQTAEEGDAVARGILEHAGASLGASAALVARRLGMEELPAEVVLAGGVFRSNSRALLSTFEMEVRRSVPRAAVARLEVPPVVGAVLRAMELAGAEPPIAVHLRLSLDVMKRLGYEVA